MLHTKIIERFGNLIIDLFDKLIIQ